MKYAFDVYYNGNIAQAACIGFKDWTDEHPAEAYKELIINVEPYQPGEFYKRELPCIRRILDKLDLNRAELIIVDGYVYLDEQLRPGLGLHLYNTLSRPIPVIGIAKAQFGENGSHVQEVFRGDSKQPLYVSAVDADLTVIADSVTTMFGPYRIPALLKQLDFLSRQ